MSFHEKIVHPILSNHLYTIFIFTTFGMIISKLFYISLGKDVWFWFFSSVAQTFAAIVALLAIFSISRFEYYRSQIIIHIEELAAFVRRNDDILHIMGRGIHRDGLIERVDNFLSSSSRNPVTHPDMEYIIHEMGYLRNLIKNYKQKENRMKIWMGSSLKNTSIIIALSVLLLPFGTWSSTNDLLQKSLEFPWLKWGLVYSVIGLCIATLYNIVLHLGELLKIDE